MLEGGPGESIDITSCFPRHQYCPVDGYVAGSRAEWKIGGEPCRAEKGMVLLCGCRVFVLGPAPALEVPIVFAHSIWS